VGVGRAAAGEVRVVGAGIGGVAVAVAVGAVGSPEAVVVGIAVEEVDGRIVAVGPVLSIAVEVVLAEEVPAEEVLDARTPAPSVDLLASWD
jgi:hypothetical protein